MEESNLTQTLPPNPPPIESFDFEKAWNDLQRYGKEEASRKKSQFQLNTLKQMAHHLKIRKDLSKQDLVESIFSMMNNKQEYYELQKQLQQKYANKKRKTPTPLNEFMLNPTNQKPSLFYPYSSNPDLTSSFPLHLSLNANNMNMNTNRLDTFMLKNPKPTSGQHHNNNNTNLNNTNNNNNNILTLSHQPVPTSSSLPTPIIPLSNETNHQDFFDLSFQEEDEISMITDAYTTLPECSSEDISSLESQPHHVFEDHLMNQFIENTNQIMRLKKEFEELMKENLIDAAKFIDEAIDEAYTIHHQLASKLLLVLK